MTLTRDFIERHGGGEIFAEGFAPFIRLRGKQRGGVVSIRFDLDKADDELKTLAPDAYYTIALVLVHTAGDYLDYRRKFDDFCSRDYAVASKLYQLAAQAMRNAFHARLFYGHIIRERKLGTR